MLTTSKFVVALLVGTALASFSGCASPEDEGTEAAKESVASTQQAATKGAPDPGGEPGGEVESTEKRKQGWVDCYNACSVGRQGTGWCSAYCDCRVDQGKSASVCREYASDRFIDI